MLSAGQQGSEARRPVTRRPRPSFKEIAIASLALAAVATVAFLPHIRHGGFYLDDWTDAAARFYPPGGPGLGNVLNYYSGLFPYRPALILYVPLKYYIFGANMALQLTWTIALGVIAAILLYGILRFFSVPWYHAWLIAALTLVYPWFDSTRFWEAASLSTIAIVLALAGFWVALVGLERRSWPLHVCAAALYLTSILTYEITLPLIAGAGILYTIRFGWRRAWPRWSIDLLVVCVAGAWNAVHTNRAVSGISGSLDHLGQIITAGGTLLGRTLYPLGPHGCTTTTLVLFGAVILVGVGAYFEMRGHREEPGWGLKHWILLAAAGLAISVLGWAMFIPADPYYTPSIYGITNRVNALAGFGLVVTGYAAIGIATSLAAILFPRTQRLVPLVVVALGLALGATYLHVVERHSRIWNAAYQAEREGMDRIRHTFPNLPPESMVITSNYPAYQAIGVPIFAAGWDLNGMIKLEYDDGTLSAFPRIEGLETVCHSGAIGVHGSLTPETMVSYGKAHLLDLQTGRHSTPHSRRQCRAAVNRYLPGPMYILPSY